jgi:hypothetical protein
VVILGGHDNYRLGTNDGSSLLQFSIFYRPLIKRKLQGVVTLVNGKPVIVFQFACTLLPYY